MGEEFRFDGGGFDTEVFDDADKVADDVFPAGLGDLAPEPTMVCNCAI